MARPTQRPTKRPVKRTHKAPSRSTPKTAPVPKWAALNNRGNTKQEEGDLDGAIADFTAAIELEPSAIAPRYNRGNARSIAGDLDGAIDDYTSAIEADPDFAPAYQRRGLTRQRKGDLDGALVDLDDAVRLAPDEPSSHGERAALRALRGDFEGAVADCERALEIAPPDWKHRSSTEHLLQTIRKAETSHPPHPGHDHEGEARRVKKKPASKKAKKDAKAKAERPADVVEEVLTRGGWDFQRVEDDAGYIDYITEAPDDGLIEATVVRLSEELERLVLYFLLRPKAKKIHRAEVNELVTRANFGMGDGNFEMDLDEGSVRFKIALDFSGIPLSPLLVRNMILDAIDTLEGYEEAFARVIAGKAKAKAAIRAAEKAAEAGKVS
jgi:tetratricopeptide (TPR) repeat protein